MLCRLILGCFISVSIAGNLLGNECARLTKKLAPNFVHHLLIESRKNDESDQTGASKRLRSAVQENGFRSIAINQEVRQSHHDGYSHIVPTGAIENQHATGTCWLYAGLRMLQAQLSDKEGLSIDRSSRILKAVEGGFQASGLHFSYAYIYFFEKLEKTNGYFEEVIKRLLKGESGPNLRLHLDPMRKIDDGAWFNDFQELVLKYGLVPYEAMPNTVSATDSEAMIAEIADRASMGAREIQEVYKKWKHTPKKRRFSKSKLYLEMRRVKKAYLQDVTGILRTHLGDPPETFKIRRWENKKISENGVENRSFRIESHHPQSFAEDVIDFSSFNYVSVGFNPLRKRQQFYLIEPSSASAESPIFQNQILNLEMERLLELIVKAIKEGHAVWFSGDVRRDIDPETGIMHPDIYDRSGIYGFPLSRLKPQPNRRDLQWYQRIWPNHAMTISAVDLDENGKPIKFGVDNSWGENQGDYGRYHMYPGWFKKNGAEVIIPAALLSAKEKQLLKATPKRIPVDDWFY